MSGHKKYLSVALLSAVLLPAMASAADAPATFTPEQEAKIGKIAADYLVRIKIPRPTARPMAKSR